MLTIRSLQRVGLILLLLTVQCIAADPLTVRQKHLWTDGSNWTISGSSVSASELETSPTGDVLVWQAYNTAKKWVQIDTPTIVGNDFSDFDTVELIIDSEAATGAQINLNFGSTGPNNGGDYYLYSFTVDWVGQKIFRLNLFTDFVKYRSPDGITSITSAMISSDGWGSTPIAGTVLRIHQLVLKNSHAGRELRDFGTQWRFNNRDLTAADYVMIDGHAAMDWDAGSSYDKWLKIQPEEPNWENWSAYDTVDLLLVSGTATGAQINLVLTSPGPNGDSDYYIKSFNVDWVGQRLLRFALPSGFSGVRYPTGTNLITKAMLSNDGWGATPTPGTSLIIRKLALRSSTQVATDTVLLSSITPLDSSITDPYETLLDNSGQAVWDAPNFNRVNYSGATFYINHQANQTSRIHFRYHTGAVQADGLPAWFSVRLFDPQDHCVGSVDLQQTDSGWYEGWIDMLGQASGRYRLVTSGIHGGFVVATDHPTPIGLNGGYMLGVHGNQQADHYVYIPNGVTDWTLRVSSPWANQTVSVYDHTNTLVGQTISVQSSLSLTSMDFTNVTGGNVWRIHQDGGQTLRIYCYGIPGVLWTSEADALSNQSDDITINSRRVAHGWQATMMDWLSNRVASDFTLQTPSSPTMPDLSSIADATMIKNVSAFGLYGFMNQSVEDLPIQILDVTSPWLGIISDTDPTGITPNADAAQDHDQSWRAYSQAWLYTYDAGGLNPYAGDPGLKNRVIAAAIQSWLMIGETEIIHCGTPTSSVPDGNAFAYVPILIEMYGLIQNDLPADLKQAFLDGIVALTHRYQHYDSYMNNQWMHILVALEAASVYGDDALFEQAYHRHLNACLNHNSGNVYNMGQSPAGYYHEQGGIDGNYNAMNEYMLALQYRKTGNPDIWDSLQKSFELRRHLLFINQEGKLNSPMNWNHRQSASLVSGYPSNRLMADMPQAAAILTRYDTSDPYYVNWNCIDPTLARNTVTFWWNKLPNDGQGTGRAGGTLGGDLAFFAPPVSTTIPQMACQLAAPYTQDFAGEFQVGRFNQWYAITYNGNLQPQHGPPGNGLALLWHEDVGPIILGDTQRYHPLDGNPDPEYLMLVSSDALNDGSTRHLAKTLGCSLSFNQTMQTMTSSVDLTGSMTLTRNMTFSSGQVQSQATLTGGSWDTHDVYLPLAYSSEVTLTAYDASNNLVTISQGNSATISRFQWDAPGGSVQMTFDLPVTCEFRHVGEAVGSNLITTVKLSFGSGDGNWTVTELP